MKTKILYVTSNPGKFLEVKHYIEANEPSIEIEQLDIDLPELQTDDQLEVALEKAKSAYKIIGKPLLIDDSAIYFNAYHKFPGVMTKFVYNGLGFNGIFKLLDEDSKAKFLLYMVYIDNHDNIHPFEGSCSGKLIRPQNFDTIHPTLPWDVVFVPDGYKETYTQLKRFKKGEECFYRIRALKKFIDWYKQNTII